jgi:hypothetical protein
MINDTDFVDSRMNGVYAVHHRFPLSDGRVRVDDLIT